MRQLAIGIDIGGTNSVFGIVDAEGNVFGRGSIPTGHYPDVDLFVKDLHSAISKIISTINLDFEIMGIGIGAPNANFYNGTIDNAANLLWHGIVPLRDKVSVAFPGLPVVMTNDAKAAAIGEKIYGGAKNMNDFIVITLGTGLGSGFVSNGKLILGHDSFAGELGHTIAVRDGRDCGCGRKGCLEGYASATGVKRTVFALLAQYKADSELRDVSYNNLSGEMLTKAADKGDPIALEVFRYTGMMLGRALADAVAITSPEAIFLFGGFSKAGKYIFEPTYKYMEENLLSNFRGKVKLLPSAVDGMNGAVLGAASLVFCGMYDEVIDCV